MQIPLEITLRDIPHSEAVETRIREKIEKLDRFHERVMSCRVTVESPQHNKHQGKLYSVMKHLIAIRDRARKEG